MPPAIRNAPSDQANEKKCLCLRPSSLLAAGFLVVAAVVLAYLGGVMSGRAYWKAHPQPIAASASSSVAPSDGDNAAGADGGSASGGTPQEPRQKVLTAEELRFSRVLRNDAATGDAPLKPMPSMTPVQTKPVNTVQAGGAGAQGPATGSAQGAAQGSQAAGGAQPGGIAKPQTTGMYDYVFQVGAFKDADAVDSLRQRLEGRGMRTKMERSGKLYVVLVLLRGDEARAAEVLRSTEGMGLGKPIQRSRKPVLQ